MTITQSVKTGSQLLLEAWANFDTTSVAVQFDSKCPLFHCSPALIAGDRALMLWYEDGRNSVYYTWAEYRFNHFYPNRWSPYSFMPCDSESSAREVIAQWLRSLA